MLRPILVILENGVVIFFTYRKGPLVECFATQNAIYLEVTISPFLQNGGDIHLYFVKWKRKEKFTQKLIVDLTELALSSLVTSFISKC
jgi:hypothetical protein